MKIIDERTDTVSFESLFIGDVFEYEDDFYLIINSSDEKNVFCFTNNSCYRFISGIQVIPRKAELIIK